MEGVDFMAIFGSIMHHDLSPGAVGVAKKWSHK